MKKKYLFMLIGIPGSGKSTWAKTDAENIEIISTDAIRGQLYGDENIQGKWSEIEAEITKRIIDICNNKDNIDTIFYDATNLRTDRRKDVLRKYKRFFKETNAVVFWTDLETCKKRNTQRERVVPNAVIERMEEHFEEPAYNEGWDSIFYVEWDDKEKEYKYKHISKKI